MGNFPTFHFYFNSVGIRTIYICFPGITILGKVVDQVFSEIIEALADDVAG